MKKFTIELDEAEVSSFIESLSQLSWDLDTELIDIKFQIDRGREMVENHGYTLNARHEVVEEQRKIVNDAMIQLMIQQANIKD